jgi:hypothetical protein
MTAGIAILTSASERLVLATLIADRAYRLAVPVSPNEAVTLNPLGQFVVAYWLYHHG